MKNASEFTIRVSDHLENKIIENDGKNDWFLHHTTLCVSIGVHGFRIGQITPEWIEDRNCQACMIDNVGTIYGYRLKKDSVQKWAEKKKNVLKEISKSIQWNEQKKVYDWTDDALREAQQLLVEFGDAASGPYRDSTMTEKIPAKNNKTIPLFKCKECSYYTEMFPGSGKCLNSIAKKLSISEDDICDRYNPDMHSASDWIEDID
jgi:hypothetical protein